jgi:mRNA interferase HigB
MAMTVLNAIAIERFCRKHRDASKPLQNWLHGTMNATWRNIVDVRGVYPSADGVTIRKDEVATVFNIKGNHYRLITAIDFRMSVVRVIEVLTHAEYDSNRWKDRL